MIRSSVWFTDSEFYELEKCEMVLSIPLESRFLFLAADARCTFWWTDIVNSDQKKSYIINLRLVEDLLLNDVCCAFQFFMEIIGAKYGNMEKSYALNMVGAKYGNMDGKED
ncbi:hypothetical protein DY000_02007959 [Brassica cretica]|uniref:F-box associated domain-containing protein n=1 Tax=Brassica cretica TaxID=69181 RepID=A0ABQ7CIF1_BRACR|nr:hypothetical protein DY000_02007959 [Brassica cretica]